MSSRHEAEYAREFLKLVDDRAQDYGNATSAQNKTNVGPAAREAYKRTLTITPSDAPPPAAPTGFTATALARAVRLTWDAPPADQYVSLTEVEYTPSGQSAITVKVDANATTLTGLTVGASHAIRIRHVNKPGGTEQPGAWSSTIVRTPAHTKAEEIALSIAGSIESGGNITINGTGEFAAGSVRLAADGIRFNQALAVDAAEWPGNTAADWLTGPRGATHPSGTGTSPYAGLAFINQSSPTNRRGMLLSAVGVSTSTKKGEITIRATDGYIGSSPDTQAATASIRLSSGVGSGGEGLITMHGIVNLDNFVFIDNDTQVTGDLQVNGALSSSGQVDFTNTSGWMTGGYKEVNLNAGGSWNRGSTTATAKRIANFVFLSGRFVNNSGTVNNPGSVITDLGADFKPSQNKWFVCPASQGGSPNYPVQVRVSIEFDTGLVKLAAANGTSNNDVTAGQSVVLDGIVFSVN